jgi:hypothetical protein
LCAIEEVGRDLARAFLNDRRDDSVREGDRRAGAGKREVSAKAGRTAARVIGACCRGAKEGERDDAKRALDEVNDESFDVPSFWRGASNVDCFKRVIDSAVLGGARRWVCLVQAGDLPPLRCPGVARISM